MKLGIIGVGAVGAATAMAVTLRARVRELVLIDRDRARARAVATDMHYGVPLSPLVTIRDGDYDDLEGAGLVIIAAGVNEKAGGATDRSDPAGRLRLLDANVTVFESIAPQLVKAAPEAVILIVTDPPEPLIDVTRHLVGHDRVIGTSTYLDSLRFRVHLAERFAVSPSCVDAYVVGEHGTSSVFLWSSSAWSPRASRRSCCEMSARSSRLAPLMRPTESHCRCRAWSDGRALSRRSCLRCPTTRRARWTGARKPCASPLANTCTRAELKIRIPANGGLPSGHRQRLKAAVSIVLKCFT